MSFIAGYICGVFSVASGLIYFAITFYLASTDSQPTDPSPDSTSQTDSVILSLILIVALLSCLKLPPSHYTSSLHYIAPKDISLPSTHPSSLAPPSTPLSDLDRNGPPFPAWPPSILARKLL